MTRILQLVTRDEPGGVQVLTEMVQHGLRTRGHEVETLALRGQTPIKLARQILRGRYEAILSYQVAAGLVGSLLGRLAGVPLRATHITATPAAMRPHWRSLDALFGALGIHTTIVANSLATARTLDAYPSSYRRRVVLIGHGVPPLTVAAGQSWRAQLRLPEHAPLLVSSGRLVDQKDHITAVRALAQLPAAHLAIAGDGPLRSVLQAEAERLQLGERLHLLGNLAREQMGALLACADIVVFPSIWESFGLAVVEAAMLGIPVVATDLAVMREVLAVAHSHDMARFHPPGNADALALQVRICLQSYPTATTRENSAVATRAAHAVDTMIEAYCRLIAT